MKIGQRITFEHKGKKITGLVVRCVPGPVINNVLMWQVILRTAGYIEKQYSVSEEGWNYAV